MPRDARMVQEQLGLPRCGDSRRQACHVPCPPPLGSPRAQHLGTVGRGLGLSLGRADGSWAQQQLCRVAVSFSCSARAGVTQGERTSLCIPQLLLHPSNAQAVCSDPPGGAKSIHPSAEKLPWYHFQWEEVSCQPASSQQGCGRIFWVRLCRKLLKCFVLMMMIIIYFFPHWGIFGIVCFC